MPEVEINAKDVMKLRQKTGLSMMECKKALVETGGDQEAAEDFLRKKMKGKMDTRTDRVAGEGRIAISIADGKAAIVELRAETDFTAKNDSFVAAANDVAARAVSGAGEADLTASIDELRISTGENISVARHAVEDGGGFGQYIHHDGKTGVLVVADKPLAEDVGKQVCQHIAAAMPRPQGVTADDVPTEVIEKERTLAVEQAVEEGKPEEIAQKMVEGKIRKLISSLALVEQDFVIDPSKKIKDILGDTTVTKFYRWQVGEQAAE